MADEITVSGDTVTPESGQAPVSGETITPTDVAVTTETTVVDPAGADKWDPDTRKYIEDLRAENAGHRTRANKFDSTFDGWPEESIEGMLNLAKAIASDDPSIVPVLEDLIAGLSPKEKAALQEQVKEETKKLEEEIPLQFKNAEDLEKYLTDREAKKSEETKVERAQEEAITKLQGEIEELGYDLSAPNPQAAVFFQFLQGQAGDGPKDIKLAHEATEKFFQSQIDAFVGRARLRGSKFNTPVVGGGAPAEGDGGNKALGLKNGGSRKALENLLANSD